MKLSGDTLLIVELVLDRGEHRHTSPGSSMAVAWMDLALRWGLSTQEGQRCAEGHQEASAGSAAV